MNTLTHEDVANMNDEELLEACANTEIKTIHNQTLKIMHSHPGSVMVENPRNHLQGQRNYSMTLQELREWIETGVRRE